MRAKLLILIANCSLFMTAATFPANAGTATPVLNTASLNPALQKCVQDESKKDWDAVISDCTRAIVGGKLGRNDMFTAYAVRSTAYAAKKNFNAMLADGDALVRIAPNQGQGFIARGAAYEGLGNPERAIAEYTNAISIDRTVAGIYLNRGDLYANAGKYPEAKKDFETCLTLDPKLQNCRLSLDTVNSAVAQNQTSASAPPPWDDSGEIEWSGAGYYVVDRGLIYAGPFSKKADCAAATANKERPLTGNGYKCIYAPNQGQLLDGSVEP